MPVVRVAAVQVASENGAALANLQNAERRVDEAVDAGAQLVLCPEFLAAGYIYEETIWDAAEPEGGLTETWLAELARRHRILIGATFLEASGEDFHNTFSLFGPDGVLGRVRKQSLPFFEGWFFAPCAQPKVIDTELGRLCVGICNDNQTAAFLRHTIEAEPDLILMPHSAPTPEARWPTGRVFRRAFESQLRNVAGNYARRLGVPVVMANKASATAFSTAIPLVPRLRIRLRFRGHSSICSADGETLQSLVDREGVLVADVEVGGPRRPRADAPRGYWSFGPGPFARPMGRVLRALDRLGRRAYRRNPRRVHAARSAQLDPRGDGVPEDNDRTAPTAGQLA